MEAEMCKQIDIHKSPDFGEIKLYEVEQKGCEFGLTQIESFNSFN